jgi:hypothetical protein
MAAKSEIALLRRVRRRLNGRLEALQAEERQLRALLRETDVVASSDCGRETFFPRSTSGTVWQSADPRALMDNDELADDDDDDGESRPSLIVATRPTAHATSSSNAYARGSSNAAMGLGVSSLSNVRQPAADRSRYDGESEKDGVEQVDKEVHSVEEEADEEESDVDRDAHVRLQRLLACARATGGSGSLMPEDQERSPERLVHDSSWSAEMEPRWLRAGAASS